MTHTGTGEFKRNREPDLDRLCFSEALDRRSFLTRMAMATGALCAPAITGCGPGDRPEAVVAKTLYGRVRGARENVVTVFKGIPYAGSPAGAYRFKPAPKLQSWSGIRDALVYGAQSIQPPDPAWPKDWKPAASSEDCLFLNVWTPGINDGKNRPVMFYSHGGGFSTGNGGADVWPQNEFHDGAALAQAYDVVVVTHNHRLGVMGYLYLGDLLGEEYASSGIAGMMDIVAALEWVRDNIAEFGGNPDNVMIWGESGGGAKTSTLTAMPGAHGLYHKASIESGAALRMRSRESAAETAREVLNAFGLNENQAHNLIKIPADDLCDVMRKLPRRPSSGSVSSALAEGLGFSPMVDGRYLPAHPYDPVAPAVSADIPLIVGINKDETIFMHRGNPEIFTMDDADLRRRLESTYRDRTDRILEVYRRSRPEASPTALYIAITTAQWMWRNAITLCERKLDLQAAPVYMYIFAYESQEPVMPGVSYPAGAAHAAEIPFKFNHPGGDLISDQNSQRAKATRNMSRAWASFARNSDPSHDEIPEWPAYTLEQRETMFLDDECRVVNDPYREERLLWKELSEM
jgi:para-nitrobenzyl esterase